MKKATNRGTCQCCGSVQMLPEGVLAKHGYTTRWGYFSGTCQGSGHKPFEQSIDLIAQFIKFAEQELARVIAFQAELRVAPAAGTTKAWVNVYRTANRYMRGRYTWMEVELVFKTHTSTEPDGHQWLTCTYEHPDTRHPGDVRRNERIEGYGVDYRERNNPLAWVFDQNRKRAQALDGDIQQLQRYIAWQQSRVKDWAPKPLLAREGGR